MRHDNGTFKTSHLLNSEKNPSFYGFQSSRNIYQMKYLSILSIVKTQQDAQNATEYNMKVLKKDDIKL